MKRLICLSAIWFFIGSFLPCSAQEIPTDELPGIILSIKHTLEKNPRILAELNKINAVERTLTSEKMQRLPAITLQGETEGNNDSEALIRLAQPLWVGGRITNAITKSEIQLNLAQTELLRVQRVLMEDTAVTYANLMGLKNRILAAEMNIKEHQRFLDLTTRRARGNVSSEADVYLAQSRLSQAHLQNEDLKGQLEVAKTDLYALTLTQTEADEPVPSSLMELPGHAEIEATIAKVSASLAQADLEIKNAQIDEALSKSEIMPRLYGRLEQELYDRGSANKQNLDTTLALVLEGTIEGAGFSSWQQVKSAKERVKASRMSADAENNDLRRNTRSRISDRDMIRQLVELNQSLAQSTAQTLASYTRQYEVGRKSWLDLLNIQQEHARARLTLEQVKSSLQQVQLRLAVQMGLLDNLSGIKTRP